MYITQRAGRNTYISMGAGAWLLSSIFVLMLFSTILFYGMITIGIVLLFKWLVRKWSWLEYLGVVWVAGFTITLNLNLARMYGWSGVWTALVVDVLILGGLILLGIHEMGGWDAVMPELTAAPSAPSAPSTLPTGERTVCPSCHHANVGRPRRCVKCATPLDGPPPKSASEQIREH